MMGCFLIDFSYSLLIDRSFIPGGDDKYAKLTQEYQRIKSQNAILKKAVIQVCFFCIVATVANNGVHRSNKKVKI